jgi:hypothetical protein
MTEKDLYKMFNSLDIKSEQILSFALETGFIKRLRKIGSMDLLCSLISEGMEGTVSYNDLASSIEQSSGTSVSRQAVCKKVNENCVDFFKLILALVILGKTGKHSINEANKYGFKQILIQDSTIIKLPKKLFHLFFGVSNATVTVCNARIQVVFDLVSQRFVSFTIDPYSKNDQSCVRELEIKEGDLTLRDRGYFNIAEIKRHIQSGADCIFRHKVGMKVLDYETLKPVDLLELLKKNGSIDMVIRLNDLHRTAARLVAQPVDPTTADLRRMKAKKNNKGHCPSKLFLELQSWTIFISTISAEKASFEDLLSLYGLRWKIETVFKCWKSNLSFGCIHNVSSHQLKVILISKMIMLIMISTVVFARLNRLIYKFKGRYISILKLTKYLCRHQEKIIGIFEELFSITALLGPVMETIARYCMYDKRKKRTNFEQKLAAALGLS